MGMFDSLSELARHAADFEPRVKERGISQQVARREDLANEDYLKAMELEEAEVAPDTVAEGLVKMVDNGYPTSMVREAIAQAVLAKERMGGERVTPQRERAIRAQVDKMSVPVVDQLNFARTARRATEAGEGTGDNALDMVRAGTGVVNNLAMGIPRFVSKDVDQVLTEAEQDSPTVMEGTEAPSTVLDLAMMANPSLRAAAESARGAGLARNLTNAGDDLAKAEAELAKRQARASAVDEGLSRTQGEAAREIEALSSRKTIPPGRRGRDVLENMDTEINVAGRGARGGFSHADEGFEAMPKAYREAGQKYVREGEEAVARAREPVEAARRSLDDFALETAKTPEQVGRSLKEVLKAGMPSGGDVATAGLALASGSPITAGGILTRKLATEAAKEGVRRAPAMGRAAMRQAPTAIGAKVAAGSLPDSDASTPQDSFSEDEFDADSYIQEFEGRQEEMGASQSPRTPSYASPAGEPQEESDFDVDAYIRQYGGKSP